MSAMGSMFLGKPKNFAKAEILSRSGAIPHQQVSRPISFARNSMFWVAAEQSNGNFRRRAI